MDQAWHPDRCPMRAAATCRNAEARCLACTWPEDGRGPTDYLPTDPAHLDPLILAAQAERASARKAARRTAAARGGRAARRKGTRVEQELARLVDGHRVPLSGQLGGALSGDVIDAKGWRWESKARKTGWRQIHRWLRGNDYLYLRADNQPGLVVMRLDLFLVLGLPDPRPPETPS